MTSTTRISLLLLLAMSCCGWSGSARAADPAFGFLENYCIECHTVDDPGGQREFETLDFANTHLDTQIQLQEIIDQLTLGSMPPEDADQPSDSERVSAIEHLTGVLESMRAETSSTGGQTVLRRLSRREYRNTVGDLLAIDMSMFDPTIEFPADNLSQHFDNIGDTLVTSGHLLEKYLDAADRCIEKALALSEHPKTQTRSFRDDFVQQPELNRAHRLAFNYRHLVLYDHPLNDKPEGAYGHLHRFADGVPVDGMYEVKVLAEALHRDTPYNKRTIFIDLDEPFRMGIRPGDTSLGDMVHTQPIQPKLAETVIDDNELKWYTFRIPLDRGFAPRFTFENGQHDVRGAYARVFRNHVDTLPASVRGGKGIVAHRNAVIKHGQLPQIRIHEVQIRGPLDVQWPTQSQQRLIGGSSFDPEKASERVRQFASRAYRRPATADEVAGLMTVYQSRVASGHTPFQAYMDTLKAALCSPAFLYLSPPPSAESSKLSQHGLAERLSYFLTSSMPDERLRQLADEGQLDDPATLREETKRLLGSRDSDAFVADFLDSWLNLRALGSMLPDPKASREYYAAGLEPEMKQETQLFLRDLIDRNASVLLFLSGNYSFVNRDLAKLYGIEDQVPVDAAADFHRVVFRDHRRGGLLGQASVLTVSANGIETSPVIRGVWLLENVLGTPTPPPPDDVPSLDPDVRGAKSIRDQLDRHSESAACNLCHRKIDPLGFALEGFDPIGRVRQTYDARGKQKIDTSGVLPGGETFAGPAELRQRLLERKEFFVRTVTNRLLSHGLGRRIEPTDRAAVDAILDQVKADDYPMADLITAIVTSDLFQQR
ncbi:DUF1592 domain-containing protein [Novipirellula caenicola]|uniref:Planctomycete cytochrome C n=1 Tax=Novipirellula caenicola TaxID=1536901 RepID=A0ABP9W0C1_9BACT